MHFYFISQILLSTSPFLCCLISTSNLVKLDWIIVNKFRHSAA